MNKVKKGLLKASSILAIIIAIFGFLGVAGLIFIPEYITVDAIKEVLVSNDGTDFIETETGYIIVLGEEDDEVVSFTDTEMDEAIKQVKTIMYIIAIVGLLDMLALMIIAIKVLKKTSQNISSKGLTIALMVLGLINTSVLIFLLCFVALWFDDEPKIDLQDPKVQDVFDHLE